MMIEIINGLSEVAEDIKRCKLAETCPELDESRQYYFEPNHVTLDDWQNCESAFRNGINTDAVFLCESPGGFAKGVNSPGFPTDGSEIYRGWATRDSNIGVQESKLRNNKKFKEFRQKSGLDDCYITNICKCGKIPPSRKKHSGHEIAACSKFLLRELEIINPKLIIAVGKKLAAYLKKINFLRLYKIIYITHYSYYLGGTAWDHWKQPGEGGELDGIVKYLKKISTDPIVHSVELDIKGQNSRGDWKTEALKEKLISLVKEINVSINPSVSFDQQLKIKKHMSLIGCNGRMFVLPTPTGYEVSIYGISVEKNLYPYLKDLFGRDCNGHRQPNERQPKWKTDDFNIVKQAAILYAKQP
jgi:hypothetical protein